jgi:hypothetical protein
MAEAEFSTRALIAALSKASEDIKARVYQRRDRAATTLVAFLHSKYPRGKTGNLIKGVSKRSIGQMGVLVRSAAKHVHFIDSEHGTKERFDNTRKNARRGRMKPNPIFIPAAIRERKSYLSDAQAIIDRPQELV